MAPYHEVRQGFAPNAKQKKPTLAGATISFLLFYPKAQSNSVLLSILKSRQSFRYQTHNNKNLPRARILIPRLLLPSISPLQVRAKNALKQLTKQKVVSPSPCHNPDGPNPTSPFLTISLPSTSCRPEGALFDQSHEHGGQSICLLDRAACLLQKASSVSVLLFMSFACATSERQ